MMISISGPALHWKREPRHSPLQAQQIVRLSRAVTDLDRAELFYRQALGFRTVTRRSINLKCLTEYGLADACAEEAVLRLGEQEIALVRFETPGRPYPAESRSDDRWFQHAAIVVNDMDAAYAHLNRYSGWRPISEDGPQHLPPANGRVKAFKFRDPDGHPLELLWFPLKVGRAVWHQMKSATPFLGIDHSAIVVASTRRSLRFYRALGFQIAGSTRNLGPAQDCLDAIIAARVRVTSLRPDSSSGPGLELLEYQPTGRAGGVIQPNDQANDWVTIAMHSLPGHSSDIRHDPDGHRVMLIDQNVGPVRGAA